jgi:hypothetical protein
LVVEVRDFDLVFTLELWLGVVFAEVLVFLALVGLGFDVPFPLVLPFLGGFGRLGSGITGVRVRT